MRKFNPLLYRCYDKVFIYESPQYIYATQDVPILMNLVAEKYAPDVKKKKKIRIAPETYLTFTSF